MLSNVKTKWRGIQLITRMDKPIGTYLLLWPTYWALWIASDGWPSFQLLIVFSLGVIIMRSAGCVINDIADMKIDGAVERTKNRPLISGLVTKKEAISIFGILIGIALGLVLNAKLDYHLFISGSLVFSGIVPVYETLYPLTTSGFRGCF